MKKYGFTLIELLAVIVILAVIALIATPIILGIISDSKKQAFKDSAYGIIDAAKYNYVDTMYSNETPLDITFTYEDGEETSSVAGKSLNYEGAKPQNGSVSLTGNGNVAIALYDGTNCAYKSFIDSEVTVEATSLANCTYDYSLSKGVNEPKLAKGMTPIKWDGSKWIDTTVGDKDWYSYDTTNKKWANVKTADGSMWVWIPRYAYKITSNHHINTTGTIEIQFSKGIKDDWNSSITLNIDTTANASNNTWTNHPGFDFGTTKLTGIWVAKFEATAVEGVVNPYSANGSCPSGSDNVTTKTIKVGPNVTSWRCISEGNIFSNIRNMETKSIYGWVTASGLQANGTFTTDTNNLDTHLMKNIEWGTIAYLSESNYGQGANEIYINNNQNYITGCAGNTVSAGGYDGCQNAYNTSDGQKASTTGNIYGIYDMSGGAWEYESAYVNNGNGNLGQGTTVTGALAQYKDVYTAGGTDDQANNYALSVNFKGDAIWETSNNTNGSYTWFSDYSYMPNTSGPWFIRGGNFNIGSNAGVFSFNNYWGSMYSVISFRPVLAVGTGL